MRQLFCQKLCCLTHFSLKRLPTDEHGTGCMSCQCVPDHSSGIGYGGLGRKNGGLHAAGVLLEPLIRDPVFAETESPCLKAPACCWGVCVPNLLCLWVPGSLATLLDQPHSILTGQRKKAKKRPQGKRPNLGFSEHTPLPILAVWLRRTLAFLLFWENSTTGHILGTSLQEKLTC